MKFPKVTFDTFKSYVSRELASYAKSPKFLNTTVGIGWGLACAAQCAGIAKNNDLTKAQKKFLIPQEISDCLLNIGLFFGVTLLLKKAALGLVNKTMVDRSIISLMHADREMVKKAATGVEAIAGLASAIVCSNIITPNVRNRLATMRQAQHFETDDAGGGCSTTGFLAPNGPFSPMAARVPLNTSENIHSFVAAARSGSLRI